jgi:hypothetical protein
VWQWLLAGVSLAEVALRADCTWTPQGLAFAAMLWAWSDEKTLGERFQIARRITRSLNQDQPAPAGSYQAFIKLLCKWTDAFVELLSVAFRQRMPELLGAVWRVEGWVVFAVDGSKVDVPRTRRNEEHYSPKSKLSRKAQKRRRQHRKAARLRKLQEARERKANVPRISCFPLRPD